MKHGVQLWLVGLVMVAAACGTGGDAEFEVSAKLTTHETTQAMWIWAPDAEGSWPVVYALPGGFGDARRDLEVLATELASHGVVVFGTYMSTTGNVADLQRDTECGYRFARSMSERGLPAAAINLGRTRADDILNLKVAADAGATLAAVAARLST